jgi:endonuclease/exonuclease/phosphatase family metal-dependent hydrolase
MLDILYWNTRRSKPNTAQALEDNSAYDVIAIQEPWLNRDPAKKGETYCPRASRYNLIHKTGGRAALYIHKRHAVAAWTAIAEADWCQVTLQGITIVSIYSESYHGGRWNSPLCEVVTRERIPRCVLAGDFNIHHPLWDRHGRHSPQAETLLALAQQWHLDLATPWGEPTHESREDRDSTIDLAWVSTELQAKYLGTVAYEGSDHRPQLVRIEEAAQITRQYRPPQGWSWTKMNKTKVQAQAAHLRYIAPEDITTPQQLDNIVDATIQQLQEVADFSTPRAKANTGH